MSVLGCSAGIRQSFWVLSAAIGLYVAAMPQRALADTWTSEASGHHPHDSTASTSSSTSLSATGGDNQLGDFDGDPPTLDGVLALARERAPEVVVAKSQAEASRSSLVGARVSPVLNPYLEVIAEHGRSVTRDVYITAQLHTPIEVGGQRTRRIAEANSFVDWHSASLEEQRARISGAAVRIYGQTVTWSARLDTLTDMLRSATVESEVLNARRDVGDVTERDAQLAEVERARIAVQLDETRASLSASMRELSRLTGRRFGRPDTTHVMPNVVTAPSPGVTRATTAPAVRSAEAESRYYHRVGERFDREKIPPVTAILQAGRGDFQETRLGLGVAWTLPTFRYYQGERARAQAEGLRASATAQAYRQSIAQRLAAIQEEGRWLRVAVQRLDQQGIPAALSAVNSATRMQQAGKIDLLSVVVARRDLFVLRLRRLELAEHAWSLLGDWVELTGELPR